MPRKATKWWYVKKLPRASPSGSLSGKGLYLTVCPWSRPNTDTVEEMESYPYSEEKHILPMNLSQYKK